MAMVSVKPAWIQIVDCGVEIRVKAVPGASRDRIAGLLGEELKVLVAAAPEKGKANQAITSLLAAALGMPTRCIRVVRGKTGPHKVILVQGVNIEVVRSRLSGEK